MANKPPTTRHEPSNVRFEQARSIGILMTLGALLGLVVYNTVAGGTPWVSRSADVQLLMTLLSLLLGVDLMLANRHTLGRFIASVLVAHFTDRKRHPPPDEPSDIDHAPERTPHHTRDPEDPPDTETANDTDTETE